MGEYLDVNGIKTYYMVEGRGYPVILIHGNGLSSGQWRPNIGVLAKYYRVYAPDLPGFGLSDKPDIEYGTEFYIGFLKAFMDALGIDKAAIVGNSYGGYLAAIFASRYPERVTGLVLSDSTGFAPGGIAQNKELYNTFLSLMIRSRRLYCRPLFYNRSAAKELEGIILVTDTKESREAFKKNCAAILCPDPAYATMLMSIAAPTLVIWGEDDLLLPVVDAEKYMELIHGAKLKFFEHCGHMPNIEKSDEFNTAVLGFLAGISHRPIPSSPVHRSSSREPFSPSPGRK